MINRQNINNLNGKTGRNCLGPKPADIHLVVLVLYIFSIMKTYNETHLT